MVFGTQIGEKEIVGLIVLGTILLLAVGVWGNWPWLATEHARLEPVHQWLIWTADGTAVLWTLWFGLCHGVFGNPLSTGPATDRSFQWVLLSLFAGMAVDGAITADCAYREEAGNRRAILSPRADLTRGRISLNGDLAYVACRLQDQAGGWHESRLSISLAQHPALGAAIGGGQFPVPVQITYDPDWPPRCWLSAANASEHQPLYVFSLCVLVFQCVLTFPMAAAFWKGQPWAWRVPVHKFVPVWGVLLPLCCGAFGKLLLGEL